MTTGPIGAAGIAAFDRANGPTGAGATDAGNVTARVILPDAKAAIQAPPKLVRPNFERMPAELKQQPNWVLWVLIWNGSKWTKRPIQVSGFGASTTKPKHWSSFDDVKQAYEHAVERGYFALREKDKPIKHIPLGGVGFVFDGQPDENGLVYAGVDFDSGALKDEILSFSAERVKRLGSYVEASVSGTGVHVIVKAHPLDSGITHNGIEMYTSGRFFTMMRSPSLPKNCVPKVRVHAQAKAICRMQHLRAASKRQKPRLTHGFPNCRPENKAKLSNTQPCMLPETRNCLNYPTMAEITKIT
jgi:primase-polymerase (primpol)-like protein